VPEIVWTEADCPELGRPYFVGTFVEGYQPPTDWREVTERDRRLGRRAMEALPRVHQAEWRRHEDVWGEQQPLESEFERLLKLWDRPTINPAEGGRLPLLRDRLLASRPAAPHIGCVHGDFHWGNIIFGDDDVRAILDWEISFIGPTLLDVGWICFYADPQAFSGEASDQARRFGSSPEELLEYYQSASGKAEEPGQMAWFRAFSAYRYGAISLFNAMLHRRGKRHDPAWEGIVTSVPQMVERGLELISP
jgi:aminoglycoside phosphotransferase (APT) family kinase protein